MADFPTQARVVIIGGGAVGASALYHLAKAGWSDALLLEKNELTAGSTWHAAGNVPTFSSSWSIMNMQRYSAELYRGLGEAVDYPMNYHVTGSVRLGHTEARLREFQRVAGMGRYQGMDLSVLGPEEIRSVYPFLDTHELTGALHDPYDGDIDPAQLTQALAKGARALGARVERFCPVTGVRREAGEWVVETPKGAVRCEIVVNAAGYRAAEVGRMFGREVPMMVMSHQYLLFENIPELEAGRRRWVTSCRCCATSIPRIISGRRNMASTSGLTRSLAGRIGPRRATRCPRISASSCSPTTLTGWNGISRTRWRGCRFWRRRDCRR